jgi:YVTN family beta-propeller protein
VAVSPGGDRLYVTNRFDSSVSVIDARTRTVVTEIAVGDEPHGVLTDSSGRTLYVLNTGQDSISVIDARDLTEVKRLAAGGGPWSLALRPDGETLYVTSVRPQPARFREPPHSEVTVVGTGHGAFVIDRPVAAEANMLEGIAWVPSRDVALFTLMRTKSLVPITRLAQGWSITNGLGILWPDGRIDQVLLDEPAASFPDPEDVAVSPDGRHALVTSGGSDHVALVDVEKLLATVTSATEQERRDVLPHHMGMSRRFVLKRIAVGSNPRGVAFSPDGRFAYVVNALDDTVTVIDTAGFNVVGAIDLGGPEQVTETRRGEKLFHSADITYGRQFSCRTCHPDGHINGLPFDIEAEGVGMHPVDNRTLRGILDTGPFKWEGTNPSLKRQCGPRLAVFFTRLNPYTPTELDALTHYIATIERPPNRYRRPEGLTPAQRRGKAIFERTRTNDGRPILPVRRCITCHNSAYRSSATTANVGSTMWFDAPIRAADIDMSDVYADPGQLGEMGAYFFTETSFIRRAFDTPHLNNIYDSAPYLHNGAAPTLEEIWTRFDQLMLHGETDDLSRQQFNDLIAYLKSRPRRPVPIPRRRRRSTGAGRRSPRATGSPTIVSWPFTPRATRSGWGPQAGSPFSSTGRGRAGPSRTACRRRPSAPLPSTRGRAMSGWERGAGACFASAAGGSTSSARSTAVLPATWSSPWWLPTIGSGPRPMAASAPSTSPATRGTCTSSGGPTRRRRRSWA